MTPSTSSVDSAVGLVGRLRPSLGWRRRARPAWDRRAALLKLAAAALCEERAAREAGYALDADMLNGLAGRLEWTAAMPSASEAWDRVRGMG